MAIAARFTHVNLVARDWRRLAAFYVELFGCDAVPPERDLSGAWIEAGTGVNDVHVRGQHLRLPGVGPEGPTIEVFAYEPALDGGPPAANRPGYGHIAFAVENVREALAQVRAHGGGALGEVVDLDVAGVGRITFCYALDPEGNVIELEHWDK